MTDLSSSVTGDSCSGGVQPATSCSNRARAARELFIAHGYGATTIDQIAARAGVSKPSVFAAVGN